MSAGKCADFDRQMMALALSVARRGLGRTAPNPAVGAVVVDPVSGAVIATGFTQPGGRPHAETVALEAAGTRAAGATLYVTLEPCSHHGKTPPCADAVIAAGIRRVVCAIADPDPRVAGRGFDRLRAAGIAVESGVLADAAHWLTRGHIVRVTERRPFVQLKLAMAADGDVPRGGAGKPTWVTGARARAQGHLLRAEADAILVGRRTVVDDDPELTCRLPGMADRSPHRIVLAGSAEVPLTSKLVQSARLIPVTVFCGTQASDARVSALVEHGVGVQRVATLAGELWLPAVLEALAGMGITRLLVEGGPQVWRAFGRAGLVDEIVLFKARDGAGGRAERAHIDALLAPYIDARGFELSEVGLLGKDEMVRLRARRALHTTRGTA